MHLGHSIPNIWYRIRLVQQVDERIDMQAIGVSLPGLPGIVVGSNTHIAWGFTNSYGDYSDRVVLRTAEAPGRYRVPRGGDTLRVREERIKVRDEPTVLLERAHVALRAGDRRGCARAARCGALDRALRQSGEPESSGHAGRSGCRFGSGTGPASGHSAAERVDRRGEMVALAGPLPARFPVASATTASRPQMSDHGRRLARLVVAVRGTALCGPTVWPAVDGQRPCRQHVNDVARIGADDYPLGVRAAQIRQALARQTDLR